MTIIVYILFSISLLFFIGMIYFLMAGFHAGVYPPKRYFRQKAIVLAGVGVLFFILAGIFYYL